MRCSAARRGSQVRLASGRLLVFYRSRGADAIYQAHSDDDGASWSAPRRTALPNNNSGIQALLPRCPLMRRSAPIDVAIGTS